MYGWHGNHYPQIRDHGILFSLKAVHLSSFWATQSTMLASLSEVCQGSTAVCYGRKRLSKISNSLLHTSIWALRTICLWFSNLLLVIVEMLNNCRTQVKQCFPDLNLAVKTDLARHWLCRFQLCYLIKTFFLNDFNQAHDACLHDLGSVPPVSPLAPLDTTGVFYWVLSPWDCVAVATAIPRWARTFSDCQASSPIAL